MDSDGARSSRINYAVTGALFLTGLTCAGPVGATALSVAGNLLTGVVQHQINRFTARFSEAADTPLRETFVQAFCSAMDNIETRWKGLNQDESVRRSVHNVVGILKEDARQLLGSENWSAGMAEFTLSPSDAYFEARMKQSVLGAMDSYLHGCDEQFVELFKRTIFDELVVCFVGELTKARSDRPVAWRAFQILSFSSVRDSLEDIRSNSEDQSKAILKSLEGVTATLATMKESPDETIIELGLVELTQLADSRFSDIQESLNAISHKIHVEHETTRAEIGARTDANTQRILDRLDAKVNEDLHSSVQVILNGVITTLALEGELEAAEATDDPTTAAQIYDMLTAELENKGFGFEGRLVRNLHAVKLESFGNLDGAYNLWLMNARDELEEGKLWISSEALEQLKLHRASVSLSLAARFHALEALEHWYEHPIESLQRLATAFQELTESNDAWSGWIGMRLVELMVIDSEIFVPDIDQILWKIAEVADVSDSETKTRALIAISELTDEWGDLPERAASNEMEPPQAGLVLSRHGRWLAWHGLPQQAIREYRKAIGFFATAKCLGDVSGALRSIEQIEYLYQPLTDSLAIRQARNTATALAGKESCVKGISNSRSAGIEHLHVNRFPDAYRNIRRFLWESHISGRFSAELDAYKLLGDVLAQTNRVPMAVKNYILAGSRKKAVEAAKVSPNAFDVRALVKLDTPWMGATALAVLAEKGDLLPSELVEDFLPVILESLDIECKSPFGPRVSDEGWNLLAAVSVQLDEKHFPMILDQLEPLIEREPNHYRHTDKSMLRLLRNAYRYHPRWQERVRDSLAKALMDPDLARSLVNFVSARIREDVKLEELVKGLADGGNKEATHMLAIADIPHPTNSLEATQHLERVLVYETGIARTSTSLSTVFQQAAQYAAVLESEDRCRLADHLIEIALDDQSPTMERASAIEAIGIMGKELTSTQRSNALAVALSMVEGPRSSLLIDNSWQESLDPLSRFRFDLAGVEHRGAAMWTAANVAKTIEEGSRVLSVLEPFLRSQDEHEVNNAAHAISWIDVAALPELPVEVLAQHPNVHLRYLAVQLWIRSDPVSLEVGIRLANDPDRGVKESLAYGIGQLEKTGLEPFASILTVLSHDPSARVRAATEHVSNQTHESCDD
jgi:tetratricopeptide (TPR) repeat protein